MSFVSFVVSPAGRETLSSTAAGVPRQPRCREPGRAGITVKPVQRSRVTIRSCRFGPSRHRCRGAITTSADCCAPISTPRGADSTKAGVQLSQGNARDLPAVSVGFTARRSVQVLGITSLGLLTHTAQPISACCSSNQQFACGFLRIPDCSGHPCRSASVSSH